MEIMVLIRTAYRFYNIWSLTQPPVTSLYIISCRTSFFLQIHRGDNNEISSFLSMPALLAAMM